MKRPRGTLDPRAVPPAEDPERRLLTRKEAARAQRRALYQRAKEQRATDPRYLAMKEAAKEQRRAAYQQAKERKQAAATAAKVKRKAEGACVRGEGHAASDPELEKAIAWLAKGSSAQN
ncbi:MAG TPA: hypothetical protein PLU22_21570 [Polyangiaceae bacterium]|nr:hypothetical protein [Polyangiaceae bacterium]